MVNMRMKWNADVVIIMSIYQKNPTLLLKITLALIAMPLVPHFLRENSKQEHATSFRYG